MKKARWKIAQWFEKNWWKNYLKNKSTEEYLNWKRNYWKNFLMKIKIQNIKYPAIDIGCGPAGIFTVLKEKNIALDPLIHKYEKDLEIFKREDYPNTTFINQSFEEYEIDQNFNTLFCLNAVNHFIDINTSFKKLNNLCSSNGQLIISVDAHNFSFFKYLFRLIPLDILHPHQYDLKGYETFLDKNGFEIEQKICIQKEFFFNYWILVAVKK